MARLSATTSRASRAFVDTADWLALLNPRGGLHAQALAARRDLQRRRVRLITKEFVLMEVADAFAEPPLRAAAKAGG